MDTTSINSLKTQQTEITKLLQDGATQNLIPESMIQSFMEVFIMATIVSSVILGLFLVIYTISAIRKWKVQSAVMHMQKDISEIKQYLMKESQPSSASGSRKDDGATPINNRKSNDSLIATDR